MVTPLYMMTVNVEYFQLTYSLDIKKVRVMMSFNFKIINFSR